VIVLMFGKVEAQMRQIWGAGKKSTQISARAHLCCIGDETVLHTTLHIGTACDGRIRSEEELLKSRQAILNRGIDKIGDDEGGIWKIVMAQ
jgi:hypothetical protein